MTTLSFADAQASGRAHALAVCDGILNAWNTYRSWSQNPYVHNEGIEAFISVKVAEALHIQFADACRVRLEVPISQLADAAAVIPRGRPVAALRSGGRVDVAFFNSTGGFTGAVEVKRHFDAHALRSDVARLATMLRKYGLGAGGTMEWGAVAALHTIWDSNRADLEHRVSTRMIKLASKDESYVLEQASRVKWLEKPIAMENGQILGAAGICLLILPPTLSRLSGR